MSKRAEVVRAVEVFKSHKALLTALLDEMDTCTDVADRYATKLFIDEPLGTEHVRPYSMCLCLYVYVCVCLCV